MSRPASAGVAASLDELRSALRRFAADRDWDQFHSAKNLAIALSVEAAELLEHFQWSSDSAALEPQQHAKVREEIADVFLYLVRLADKLDIDILVAAAEKIDLNAAKYPVERARGSSKKYSDL